MSVPAPDGKSGGRDRGRGGNGGGSFAGRDGGGAVAEVVAEPEAGPFTDREGRRAVATTVEAGSFARQRRWRGSGRALAAG